MIKENIIKLFYGIEIGTNLTTILLGHACVYVYICVRTRAHALFWYVKILDIFFFFVQTIHVVINHVERGKGNRVLVART